VPPCSEKDLREIRRWVKPASDRMVWGKERFKVKPDVTYLPEKKGKGWQRDRKTVIQSRRRGLKRSDRNKKKKCQRSTKQKQGMLGDTRISQTKLDGTPSTQMRQKKKKLTDNKLYKTVQGHKQKSAPKWDKIHITGALKGGGGRTLISAKSFEDSRENSVNVTHHTPRTA